MQPAVGVCQRVFVGVHAVAEALFLVPDVAVQNLAVAAEFRQREHTAVRARRAHFKDIFVDALVIARALIVPAAGMIDGAGGIHFPQKLCGRGRVELPPALVEGHPGANAHRIAQGGHQLAQLGGELFAGGLVFALEAFVAFILHMDAKIGQRHGDAVAGIGCAAGHILPHQHAQPVAVIVPARGFCLDVLAQHVEAERLGALDVRAQRLVGGGGVQAVRPIALIEQPALKIRLAVEQKTGRAGGVLFYLEGAQAEIAGDAVYLFAGTNQTEADII